VTNKNKSHICYECRQKGHMGKDFPNGNVPNQTLSIMISVSLGMIRMGIVL
jgi:hypothetical protein